jgi:ceramide glucosyltransferase
MPEWIALSIEIVAVLLTLAGMAYGVLALWGAKAFDQATRAALQPGVDQAAVRGVTVLKPMRGLDGEMQAALESHCQQTYAGPYELLFGVSSLADAAVAEIARLRVQHPEISIRVVECTERLGSNGKVSNLVQMLPHALYEHVIVNDADIRVGPRYIEHVMAVFHDPDVGLVTTPYRGRALGGVWSKLEALGIATDFFPGVLTARRLEHGIRFGLGSTLATTKTALEGIGGFESLVNELADDYELGARISKAGYRVELAREVVETSVPAYTLRGFCDHQLRWARSVRDSRRAGYVGMGVTYVLPWALAVVLASGASLWSLSLLSMAVLVRVSLALTVGVGILQDEQVLRDLWLLPLRDCFGLFFWVWSYASDVVVWRGERFRLKDGRMERVEPSA